MSGPSVYLTLPSPSLFKFPPDFQPAALPAPVSDERSLRIPFSIDPTFYNAVLRPEVPLTFATCYIIIVWLLNAYNRSRNHKPWWISSTRLFKTFVVLHNVALAIYSATTFIAMFQAIGRTLPELNWHTPPAHYADALCKLHGPRGLGDAAAYNTTLNIWESKNILIHLAPEGTPDPTDVGRLWGEGLAFWGWLFYLSKFYEVLDTLIILARGKRSPTLQTFHHAGAMMCMWAGIRYMSPPIWMFVFINSFIHSLMYVYFALASVGVRVPQSLKRTLTTMQIMQFVFGASYAALHLFVKYDIPITTFYKVYHPVASVASVASSSAVSVTSSLAEVTSTAAPFSALVKRMLLRAAGDEGVAENIRDHGGHAGQVIMPGIMPGVQEAVKQAAQRYREETISRTEYTKVDCIDTSGQTFAIWLNLFYLFPLTLLFLRFFFRAYFHRTSSSAPKQTKRHAASQSAVDAAKGVDREVDDVAKVAERQVEKDIKDMREGKYGSNVSASARRVSDRVQSFERKVTQRVSDMTSPSQSPRPAPKSTQEKKEDVAEALEDAMRNIKEETVEAKVKTEEKASDDKSSNDNAASTSPSTSTPAPASAPMKEEDLSSSHLSVPDATEGEDDDGPSDHEGRSGADSAPATPSKKAKKRRNKKNKQHAAEQAAKEGAGEMGSSSYVDVSAQEPTS